MTNKSHIKALRRVDILFLGVLILGFLHRAQQGLGLGHVHGSSSFLHFSLGSSLLLLSDESLIF